MNAFLQSVERRALVTARLATQDSEEALDIVQDAMLALVSRYQDHSEKEWGALFHSILHSKINDWHRRRQVRSRWRVFSRTQPEELEDDNEVWEPENTVAQTQFLEPELQLQSEQLGEELVKLIEALPLRQQQALVLRAWEGYDIAQTAAIMGCSEGSVKTHFSRAVHSLRQHLGVFR
ncbi:RNA polymerase sigma factor [Thiolinea disciformis]|uniref:RNA polymerase sigma factor n=1 Tax=Thiolinea disciformis TaxID=125614 RepID=UPI0003772179|nr:RNA polymerase sigma factor [Thiolinea disciformis]